jgi:hypothetical protein
VSCSRITVSLQTDNVLQGVPVPWIDGYCNRCRVRGFRQFRFVDAYRNDLHQLAVPKTGVFLVCAMAARRHLGRVSSGVLPSDASPYQAMSLIIGESLKERYGLPDAVPTSMEDLLRQLQGEDTSSERGC